MYIAYAVYIHIYYVYIYIYIYIQPYYIPTWPPCRNSSNFNPVPERGLFCAGNDPAHRGSDATTFFQGRHVQGAVEGRVSTWRTTEHVEKANPIMGIS